MPINPRTGAISTTVRVTGITIAVSSGTSDNADAPKSETTSASDDGKTSTRSDNSAGWFRPLDKPVKLPGGVALSTLAEAGAYILDLPEHIKERTSWQRATDLLLKAANGSGGVEDATSQFERALFMDHIYDGPLLRSAQNQPQ